MDGNKEQGLRVLGVMKGLIVQDLLNQNQDFYFILPPNEQP